MVRSDPGPRPRAGRGGGERRGPSATVKVAWSALSWALSTAARILYNDNTDAWSASTLLILDRLIDQNHLPKSTAEAADRLHRLNVQAGTNLQADREGGPSGFVEISAAQAVKHVMVASSLITAIAKIPAVRAELEDRERADGELRAAFLREVEQAAPSAA